MKKTILPAVLALATALSLTSCKDDTQPRLYPAEEGTFVLYEPANNNYTYDLSDGSTITLTTAGQPDYGVATPTQYQVQISLTDTWKDAVVDPETEETVEYATYYNLPSVSTQSVITAKSSEIAKGMNVLMGVRNEGDEGNYDNSVRPLYVRVRAYVKDPVAEKGYLDYSEIYSNVIKINKVQPVLVVPTSAKLWMIGDYQGWDINGGGNTVVLTEDENGMGSDIYTGYVYWAAGPDANTYFRFYSATGDWENNSIGSAATEENVTIEMGDQADGSFSWTGNCYNSKGNWLVGNFPEGGGWMKITVDLNTMKVTFTYDPDHV